MCEVQQPVALFPGFVTKQDLSDASPEWERRVRGGGAAHWKTCVASRGQRRAFGCARLIHRLVERVFVDVAVEAARANVAVIDIAGKYQMGCQAVSRR